MPSGGKSRVRVLAYGLIILFPLIFFGVIEGALRILDLYDPAADADPFIGLLESHRVFLTDENRGVHYIDRYRAQSFNVQSFPIRKADGTFRVFCLGGSAAYGYPFGAPVAFARWLQDACQRLWPGRRFEVVNAAGMSYGSYRVRALVKEILEYEPDLIVIYSGHNEFIEKEFYIQSGASRLVGVRGFLSHFHLYNLLKKTVLGISRRSARIDASFDEFGLHVARRENIGWTREERATVLEKYRENIAAIVRTLRKERVPTLLMVPAPNVGDWRPEHSVLSTELTSEQVAIWSAAYTEGIHLQEGGQWTAAIASFERAREIDDRHAELHYRLGQCWEASADYAQARRFYEAAADRDDVPIRVSSAQRRALRDIAAQEGPLFADAWRGLAQIAPRGILGDELFWDYCHPNLLGHQRVAALACSVLIASGILPPPDGQAAEASRKPLPDWDLQALGMAEPDSFDLGALPLGADGLWWLGNCAQRQGARELAGRYYRQSLDADANHPGSLIGLAIERSHAGEHDQAIELCQRALAIYERAGRPRLITRAHAELGVFYSRAGRLAEAAGEFRAVLRQNPVHLMAHKNLARALLAMEQLAEAEEVLREGIRQLPRERDLHKLLGHVLRQQGRSDDAAAAYEQELRLSPGDFSAHDALGDLYQASGRVDEAAAHWEAALRARPGSEETALKLTELYLARGREADARRVMEPFHESGRTSPRIEDALERVRAFSED